MATLHALETADAIPRLRGQGQLARAYLQPLGSLQPQVGPLGPIVAGISVDSSVEASLGAAAIPQGAARPEALAVLIRRAGGKLEWGDPVLANSFAEGERFAFERGRSSVMVARAMPSLVSELQVGGWFNTGWRGRALLRMLVRAPRLASMLRGVVRRPATIRLAADVWFWAGARADATREEWSRLTRSSYVALCYHQLSDAQVPVHDELDVPSSRFAAQLRLLKFLRFKPLTVDDVLRFHTDTSAAIGRRRYLLSADDGYRDALKTLTRVGAMHPVAFVVSSFAAGTPNPDPALAFASYDQVRDAASCGVTVGVHSRRHRSLVDCSPAELEDELTGATHDLKAAGFAPVPIFAYPYGRYDLQVREAAAAAGYALAYSTEHGRNGIGTDCLCLRRITIKPGDDLLGFAWKVITGEPMPNFLRHRGRRSRPSNDAAGR